MSTGESRDIFDQVAEKLHSRSLTTALGEVAMTAASFLVPPADRLYREIHAAYRGGQMPLQPSVEQTVDECADSIASSTLVPSSRLNSIQQTRLVPTMFQFSDRTPTVRSAMTTPHQVVEELYDYVTSSAEQTGPVTYGQQFAFAIDKTQNIPSALWNLMITGRHFARWRDSPAIEGLPEFTRQEKLDQILTWERSVAACKPADDKGYHDTSGDNYYVWTHALARTIYDGLPERQTWLSRGYTTAFGYGSHAMGLSRQVGMSALSMGTMSDHLPASIYGNAIGQLCADAVKTAN